MNLVGIAAISDIYGPTGETVRGWVTESTFPNPVTAKPYRKWDLSQVDTWVSKNRSGRGHRKSSGPRPWPKNWVAFPDPIEALKTPAPKFSDALADVIEDGVGAALLDPNWGSGNELVVYRRIGFYADAAIACERGRWANDRYAKEMGGYFDWHSEVVTSRKKEAWLLIRWVPNWAGQSERAAAA